MELLRVGCSFFRGTTNSVESGSWYVSISVQLHACAYALSPPPSSPSSLPPFVLLVPFISSFILILSLILHRHHHCLPSVAFSRPRPFCPATIDQFVPHPLCAADIRPPTVLSQSRCNQRSRPGALPQGIFEPAHTPTARSPAPRPAS